MFGAPGQVKSLYRKGREEKPQRAQKTDAREPHDSGSHNYPGSCSRFFFMTSFWTDQAQTTLPDEVINGVQPGDTQTRSPVYPAGR
jgi:hypothetical protein